MTRSITLRAPRALHLLLQAGQEHGPRAAMLKAGQELGKLLQSPRLAGAALAVRSRTGKSLRSQAYEIARLRLGEGRLSPFDYYAYGLYDDSRYSFAEKRAFISRRPRELFGGINDPEWKAICDDKLITYGLFQGLRLPHPEIYAVYQPGARTFGPTPCLRTPEAVAAHLRREMRYPFFGKPIRAGRGIGVSSVERIDRARDVLVLAGGREIPVEEYVRRTPTAAGAGRTPAAAGRSGYLFQERIRQHPLIEGLTGGRIACVRLMILLGPDGPHLFRALWKIAVDDNLTEHTAGQIGNLRCYVDPATGRIERAVQSPRPEEVEAYGLDQHGRPIEAHPNTGERITGFELPHWRETVDLCLGAAAALPGVRFQSWDLAVGADGPLLIEVNYHGVIPQSQVPGCRGFYDDEFRRIAAAMGRS